MRDEECLTRQPHGAPEFSRGDWVAQTDTEQPHFGIVKDMFSQGNEWFANIDMWNPDGTNPGRHSPPEGGPKSFEPACNTKFYGKIEKPDLPLDSKRFTLRRGYSHLLKFLKAPEAAQPEKKKGAK